MKRILDITGALVGVVLLSPLLAVVWLAVMLESGLPGLFRQRRMGRGVSGPVGEGTGRPPWHHGSGFDRVPE